MKDKLCILVCPFVKREVDAALKLEGLSDVEVAVFPARCQGKPLEWADISRTLPVGEEYSRIVVLGGYCLAGLQKSAGPRPEIVLHQRDQCAALFVNPSLVSAYIQAGGYLLTPGWLAGWRSRLDQWGFDSQEPGDDVRNFFGESASRLQLLDTGIDEKSEERLEEFSNFVGLPFERTPVGLDYLRLELSKISLEWRIKNKEVTPDVSPSESIVADYAMAMDMLADLSHAMNEAEAIEHILTIFTILVAPKELFYLPVRNGRPQEIHCSQMAQGDGASALSRLENFTEDHAWTEVKTGFVLRIIFRNETVGIVEVNEVAFPEHKERYLNLALSLVGVCGLAIDNARTYEKLTSHKNQLAATLDAVPDLLLELGLDSYIFDFHTHQDDLLYCSYEKYIGNKMLEILPPAAAAVVQEALAEVHETGHSKGRQYAQEIDGKEHWFELSMARKSVGAGEAPRFISISHDITERKQAILALQVSEEKFRALYDNAPLSYQSLDESGHFLDMNPTWLKTLGYEQDEVVGKCFADFLHPDWKSDFAKKFPEFKRLGSVHDVEYKIRHKDGHYLDILFEGCIGYLPDGSFRQTYCVFQDVSARKNAEAEKDRLLAGIEQASESIMTADIDGIIEYVNPAFERMTGYSRDEVVGQNPRILQSGTHSAAFYSKLWKTLTAGKIWHGRFVNRRKNGECYTEETTISPVMDSTGRIINYVAIKADVTAELAREMKFRQMQKMESVGQMAGGIGHEFNNVLQSITGYCELILMGMEGQSVQRQNMLEIQKAAYHAAELTRQLLVFSRKGSSEYEVVNLNALLFGDELLLRQALDEDTHLKLELDPQLKPVFADTSLILQVAMNLVLNARDAMSSGGTILLSTMNRTVTEEELAGLPNSKEGAFACISVSDTGCGMNDDQLAHLFDPFYTTKPLGKGTGLGLAVAYGSVQEHGGWISVTSELGRGSNFEVFLPIHVGEDAPDAEEGMPVAGNPARRQVLLVDHDAVVRNLAGEIVQAMGYEVFMAASTCEAEEVFAREEGAFDLLFSDVMLPDGNGIDLADALLERTSGLSVLLFSDYADEEIDIGRIKESGYNYMKKPLGLNKIMDAIGHAIKG